jgi:hypothetical protein
VRSAFHTEQLVLGLAIAWVGVVATLGNLGVVDTLAALHRWWPVILVAWGVLDLFRVQRLCRERAAEPQEASL